MPTVEEGKGDPSAPASGKIWRVGTLSYTSGGLAVLFCWLLWGDFAWSLRDRVVPSIMQLLFKKFGASDAFAGFLFSSLPCALGLIIGPIVGYKSDRLRTRMGRRIPFLLFTVPFIVLSIIGLAFCAQIGGLLHRMLGHSSPGLALSTLISLGVSWTIFEISVVTANTVFGGLVNDVVPQELLGRCYGLFRAVGLLAGILFNFSLFGGAAKNFTWIFLGVGAVYAMGLSLMCLKVREGQYPPPPMPCPTDQKKPLSNLKSYFRDGFGHAYYLWFFAAIILTSLSTGPFNFFALYYAHSVSMSDDTVGKCLALTYLCSLLLAYPLGSIADRFHPLRVSIVAVLLYAGSMAYGFFFVHNLTTFAIAFVVQGVISGMLLTVIASLGQRLLPRAKFTEISSAGGMIASVVGIMFAPSVGFFLDFTHHQYRYTFLMGLINSILAVGTLLILHQKFMALGGPKHYVAPES